MKVSDLKWVNTGASLKAIIVHGGHPNRSTRVYDWGVKCYHENRYTLCLRAPVVPTSRNIETNCLLELQCLLNEYIGGRYESQ